MTKVELREVNIEENGQTPYSIEKVTFLDETQAVLPKVTEDEKSIISIDDEAGKDALLTTDELIIPNTIQLVGVSAFEGNYIKSVKFEEGATCYFVQADAFKGIETNVFTVPDSIMIEADSGLKAAVTILNDSDIDITDKEYGFKLSQSEQEKSHNDDDEQIKKDVVKILKKLNEHDVEHEVLYYKGVKLINTGFFWEVS